MDKHENIKEQILIPPEAIIDEKLYRFLILLMGNIFIKPKNGQTFQKSRDKLNEWIKIINDKLKKNISTEYSIDNLKNIIDFVKSQNKILAGDILEGILILIFSYAFKTRKENTFSEFIFKTFKDDYKYKLEESDNYDLAEWFIKDKFIPNELQNIKELLEKDNKTEENENIRKNMIKNSPLYYLLIEIQKLKLININDKNKNEKINKYIYGRNFKYNKIIDTNFSSDFMPKKIIRYFFISVFIYYQNKHSSLIKYTKEEKREIEIKYEDEEDQPNNSVEKEVIDLAGIPFDYNLSEAFIQSKLANTVLSPSRIEPRISKITMSQNKLDERGMYELSKVLIFNKFVKKCHFDTSFIKSYYLDYLNLGLGIYDNYTLEELDLSMNSLNKESGEYLSNILSHLKNLKTINLSSNDLKNSVSTFFVMLKTLYRQKKTNLENLVLNKCNMDNNSFYELGELLKSKFCNLKRLYLNNNIFPTNCNFLKKLKKNKTLTQIYLNKNNLNETHTDDIMRLISNTHLETLYLYKNKISLFSDCLRILFRTKLVQKLSGTDSKGQSSFLINLDISDNFCSDKNADKIENLLKNIIKNTTLYSMDLSHILYDNNSPDKVEKKEDNADYIKKIDEMKKELDEQRDKYAEEVDEQNCLKVDIEEDTERVEEYKNQILEDKDFNEDKLKVLLEGNNSNIIFDQRAKYPLFLREQAKKKITEIVKNENSEFHDFYKKKLIIKSNKEGEEGNVNVVLYKKLENFILYSYSLDYRKNNMKMLKIDRKMIII